MALSRTSIFNRVFARSTGYFGTLHGSGETVCPLSHQSRPQADRRTDSLPRNGPFRAGFERFFAQPDRDNRFRKSPLRILCPTVFYLEAHVSGSTVFPLKDPPAIRDLESAAWPQSLRSPSGVTPDAFSEIGSFQARLAGTLPGLRRFDPPGLSGTHALPPCTCG
jgi:hypothetical protein